MALYYLRQTGEYHIETLLTSINRDYQRISMHGVRLELLKQQAESLGLALHPLLVPQQQTLEEYDALLVETLTVFKNQGIEYSIFGDIFLEDLRHYRESQLAKVGLRGVFPIWKKSTDHLIRQFIDLGFKAIVVCIDERFLNRSFAGREINHQFLQDLPKTVDPCGENGEFHTFVYEGPTFSKPVAFKKGGLVYKQFHTDDLTPAGFWYCDLLPEL